MRLWLFQSGAPINLDHVAFRVLEIKGNRDAVEELEPNGNTEANDLAVEPLQGRQRTYLKCLVGKFRFAEHGDFVALLTRTATQEGSLTQGRICATAANDLHAHDIAVKSR